MGASAPMLMVISQDRHAAGECQQLKPAADGRDGKPTLSAPRLGCSPRPLNRPEVVNFLLATIK